MDKIYKIKDITKDKEVIANKIFKETNMHNVLAKLYALRNITSVDDINLKIALESYKNLYNINLATQIIIDAIKNNNLIYIVADYDVDGATSCAIAVRGLKMMGANVKYFVPNRFIHGYGLTPMVIDDILKIEKPNLIITVDNGITSVEGVLYAKEKGIKTLITDHHLEGDVLPDADCIINPNQKKDTFKNKSMAGCGVIFYVLSATKQQMIANGYFSEKNSPNIFSLIYLVAIGTISDVVKLETNNRILVKYGLEIIRQNKASVGINALCNIINKQTKYISTKDIGFSIAPRINAAGRLDDMSVGIQLLLTDDEQQAQILAERLNSINQERRSIEGEMQNIILQEEAISNTDYCKIAYDPSFHEGVIGIVASRLKEKFYLPSIVFSDSHDSNLLKGSGRSIPEIHIKDVLDSIYNNNTDLIVKFGGHAAAAGLTIRKENLNKFIQAFNETISKFISLDSLQNIQYLDLELQEGDINTDLARQLEIENWGVGFEEPKFYGHFEIIEQTILKEKHLKLLLKKGSNIYEGIWFMNNEPITDNNANIVYNLQVNRFRNQEKVQLLIEGLLTK